MRGCPVSAIGRLALDENSRTSATLVRILLRELHGIDPQCVALPPRLDEMMDQADAALMIGDPALAVDRSGLHVVDLAAAWHALTGRPFVFAVWAVRGDIDIDPWLPTFQQSLESGRAALETLIHEAALEMGLSPTTVREYLTECLSFELGPAEQAGLEEFLRRARALDLIDRQLAGS